MLVSNNIMWTETQEKYEMLRYGIEQNQFPRYTYKYRPINQFTESIFNNAEISFSTNSNLTNN